MKCSLGISNFLQEISSLSHSVVFLYFCALITEECFLISHCYYMELFIQMEELPMPKSRGSGQEELLHFQGAVAVRAQESREELPHVQGQEGQL